MYQGRSDDQACLPGIFAGLSEWHAGMAWDVPCCHGIVGEMVQRGLVLCFSCQSASLPASDISVWREGRVAMLAMRISMTGNLVVI